MWKSPVQSTSLFRYFSYFPVYDYHWTLAWKFKFSAQYDHLFLRHLDHRCRGRQADQLPTYIFLDLKDIVDLIKSRPHKFWLNTLLSLSWSKEIKKGQFNAKNWLYFCLLISKCQCIVWYDNKLTLMMEIPSFKILTNFKKYYQKETLFLYKILF